jgi:hypothetical protein
MWISKSIPPVPPSLSAYSLAEGLYHFTFTVMFQLRYHFNSSLNIINMGAFLKMMRLNTAVSAKYSVVTVLSVLSTCRVKPLYFKRKIAYNLLC